jgi:hypothetical protein
MILTWECCDSDMGMLRLWYEWFSFKLFFLNNEGIEFFRPLMYLLTIKGAYSYIIGIFILWDWAKIVSQLLACEIDLFPNHLGVLVIFTFSESINLMYLLVRLFCVETPQLERLKSILFQPESIQTSLTGSHRRSFI